MCKETLKKDLVKFKLDDAALIEQGGIASILGLALLFLQNFWVGATITYSRGEKLTIVIITMIFGKFFRISQTARGT